MPMTGREKSSSEKPFAYAVDIRGRGGKHRLQVHRFPERTGFDILGIEGNAQSLNGCIRLDIGVGRNRSACRGGYSAHQTP